MRIRTALLHELRGDRRMEANLTEAMGVRVGDVVSLVGVDGLWEVVRIGPAHEPIAIGSRNPG